MGEWEIREAGGRGARGESELVRPGQRRKGGRVGECFRDVGLRHAGVSSTTVRGDSGASRESEVAPASTLAGPEHARR